MRIGVGAPQASSRGSGASFVVQSLTTETWLTMLLDGRLGDRLVSRWSWDDSHTVLSLTLRKDIYFHDGSQLTPEIAAKALQKSVKGQEYPSFSSITSVTTTGDDTVTLVLAAPNSFLLSDLSLTSVTLPTDENIGTGPFQIESTSEQQTVMKAFPKYYRGAPRMREIDLNTYPTQRKAWAALMRGEVDMLHEVSRDAVEFVEAETTVNTFSFPRTYYIPLVFNVRHPLLQRAEVRIAINEALDRAAIVRDGMRGHGRPAEGPVWPEHWAQPPGSQGFVFDPDAAQRRLDNAGLPLKAGADGTPLRFSFSCLLFANDTRFYKVAVLVQKQLADVGIDMKLVPVPQKQLVTRLTAGDFDAFIFEMAGRSLSWAYLFWRSGQGWVDSGYTAADPVLDRIRAARSETEIKTAVAELASTLHRDPPAAFLAWQQTSRAVATRFDVAAEPNRDIFTSIWQWRPAPNAQKLAAR